MFGRGGLGEEGEVAVGSALVDARELGGVGFLCRILGRRRHRRKRGIAAGDTGTLGRMLYTPRNQHCIERMHRAGDLGSENRTVRSIRTIPFGVHAI
jgi:hypothetical protein